MKEQFSTKLTETLATFDKYTLNRFRKYVASPFFNEDERLLVLFDLLAKDLKKYGLVRIGKEKQWQAIVKNTSYNDIKFRRFHSDLLKLLEGFVAQRIYLREPANIQLDLLRAINQWNLTKLENTALKQAQKIQEKSPYRNPDYYLNAFRLNREKEFFERRKFHRDQKTNIGSMMDNLDYFYLGEKLKNYCELINNKKAFQIDYEPVFAEEILEHLRKNSYEHIPTINIYYHIFLMLTEKDSLVYFERLLDLLTQHIGLFPHPEAQALYGQAQNYCILKINSGQGEFMEKLFEIYQTVLEKEIILTKEVLSVWDYKNIVTVGSRIGKYDWVEQFIHQYKNQLSQEFRETAYSFNLARLFFSKKEYNKVIELLATVEYQDIFYLLDSKTMLLKTYFETNEDEALYALLDSFKVLLNRKKVVAPAYRTNYGNLVKHTRKLMAYRNGKKVDLKALLQTLESDSNVADLGWLKEKIGELE